MCTIGIVAQVEGHRALTQLKVSDGCSLAVAGVGVEEIFHAHRRLRGLLPDIHRAGDCGGPQSSVILGTHIEDMRSGSGIAQVERQAAFTTLGEG